MNKTISCYDLLLADPLKGFTQFDCIDLNNMDVVNGVLGLIGFDIEKPIAIYAAQHRTMANQIRIGYVFAGYLASGREHVRGKYSTIHDTYAAAENMGQDWYEELISLGTCSPSYATSDALDDAIPTRENAEHKAEEQRILSEIQQYEDILFLARNDQRKQDGSYKAAHDYKNPEVAPPKRKKKKKEVVDE